MVISRGFAGEVSMVAYEEDEVERSLGIVGLRGRVALLGVCSGCVSGPVPVNDTQVAL